MNRRVRQDMAAVAVAVVVEVEVEVQPSCRRCARDDLADNRNILSFD